MKLRTAPVFVAAFAALITLLAQAQQPAATPGSAPGKDKAKANGGAPKGITWPSPPLPDSPYKFDTGIERNLPLTITKGLKTPLTLACSRMTWAAGSDDPVNANARFQINWNVTHW